ncbi:hypothetical protein BGZ98_004888, partial [Dissophora globulifera]
FIPTDFDHTFSIGSHPDIDTTYKEYAHTSLTDSSQDRPLVTKLIYKNREINKEFETTLRTITKEVFYTKALDARINFYETQIEQDVAWDFSIDRSKLPGGNYGQTSWTILDFHRSINGPVGAVLRGIKPWIIDRAKSVASQIGE